MYVGRIGVPTVAHKKHKEGEEEGPDAGLCGAPGRVAGSCGGQEMEADS